VSGPLPRARAQLAALDALFAQVDEAAVAEMAALIDGAGQVIVAGRGRTGLVMLAFANRLMHLDVPVAILGDVLAPPVRATDLVVIGSGSGRTASLVGAAGAAREIGAQVALLTGARESPLAGLATAFVHLPARSPKAREGPAAGSVHPLGSLFEQALWILCDTLVLEVKSRRGLSDDDMFRRHANIE
jgi:6-phospho-3-hexuloisomerase